MKNWYLVPWSTSEYVAAKNILMNAMRADEDVAVKIVCVPFDAM